MKFLDSFIKSRKTYTNITPRRTHFISNMPKTKSILQKSKQVETINSISAPSEVVKSLSLLSILSSLSSVSSSPLSSPSINENSLMQSCIKSTPENQEISSLVQPCIKSTPENQEISSLVQPCIKSTPANKKNKAKNTIIQEVDEVDKSFMNLSSVMSQHFSGKQKMDEDDVFGSTIAYQLRKIEEPRKTQLKGKIMKTLYEF